MTDKIKARIREDSTIPACLGDGAPIPPNDCRDCKHHSDYTCHDVKVIRDQRREK